MENFIIFDSMVKAESVLKQHKKAVVSISGGADSDIMLDLLERVRRENDLTIEMHYVFFDTGVELQATKEHLQYLEKKYNIQIDRIRAEKSIPFCIKNYGVPFLSKMVSKRLQQLQNNDFKFEDLPYKILIKKYPNCITAVKWWCNCYVSKIGRKSMFNISYNKWLKEFLMQNPPTFLISDKCCYYAKKKLAEQAYKKYNADLNIMGLRHAEGGRRAILNSCYSYKSNGISIYKPIFWYTNDDKIYYENNFNIVFSRCYTEYGFKRTGCVGCPYNINILEDLAVINQFEPNMYKIAMYLFKQSYDYTKKYREFQKKMNQEQEHKKSGFIGSFY